MSFWRVLQTVCRVAGWCCLALAILGGIMWATGGDVEHGTAGGKLLVALGGLGAVIGLTLGHRERHASSRPPA